MKHLFLFVCLLLVSFGTKSQVVCTPPVHSFNSMSNISGTGGLGSVYRFTNSLSGVNTFVTITKLQNASITNANMDITGSFALAWQPTITFTNAKVSGDSSYIEFTFKYVQVGSGVNLNSINNPSAKQDCMAMTIVDCDGPGNANTYREMVKVSLPATPIGIVNSTINVTQDARWINLISGTQQFSSIDTTDYAAMAEIDFPYATDGFKMRVGATGAVTTNLDRQFSFYFKSFTGLNFVLPVNLIKFDAKILNAKYAQLDWATASEQDADRFEVYRSFNGKDFEMTGSVKASGNSQDLKEYAYTDFQIAETGMPEAYYKLKMVETNGDFHWSGMSKINFSKRPAIAGTVNVYPNPANNNIEVSLSDFAASDFKMEIVDVYGKCVKNIEFSEGRNSNSVSIEIADLNKGLYFIRLMNNEGGDAATVKFVKE